MDLSPTAIELDAALLQVTITFGLALLFGFLYRRYRKPYLGWWALAWVLFGIRITAIGSFLLTADRFWLFAHQVLTGWTALALLWATLVFARGLRWRALYLGFLAFPLLWSYIAIYQLETFLLAALPAVLFLSLATLAPAIAFFRFRSRTGSIAAGFLSATFLLWSLHHLDYPLLRARGAWNPWGYYLDIGFILAIGSGTLLLLIEELRIGLRTLSAMAGDLHGTGPSDDALDLLLQRPLGLVGVRGSAFFELPSSPGPVPADLQFVRGSGLCSKWNLPTQLAPVDRRAIAHALVSRRPTVIRMAHTGPDAGPRFATILPVFHDDLVMGGLVIAGDLRDPFTALDEDFLLALGRQVGSALEREALYENLAQRQADLERLSIRMIRQQEEERRRLSRELHDETAQVFSAMKLQLGGLRESVAHALGPRVDHLVAMVDTGIESIRNVTNALRPTVLDDLGLLPALRALSADFENRTNIRCHFTGPDRVPDLVEESELALFRALQEALSNIIRHANATEVQVTIRCTGSDITLDVLDNGSGIGEAPHTTNGVGLAGMQERFATAGGNLTVTSDPNGGTHLHGRMPLNSPAEVAT